MNSKPPVCAASTPLALPAASNTYDYVQLTDTAHDSTRTLLELRERIVRMLAAME
ncbi:MAG: hypothetical protein H5U34_06385, partial [Klebsiella pneumoniae]|nr:hypothetical protein [Klebsiella pneumoniae]